MMAFRSFLDSLPIEKLKNVDLFYILKLSTDHGTDLDKVREYLFGEKYIDEYVFYLIKLDRKH